MITEMDSHLSTISGSLSNKASCKNSRTLLKKVQSEWHVSAFHYSAEQNVCGNSLLLKLSPHPEVIDKCTHLFRPSFPFSEYSLNISLGLTKQQYWSKNKNHKVLFAHQKPKGPIWFNHPKALCIHLFILTKQLVQLVSCDRFPVDLEKCCRLQRTHLRTLGQAKN